MSMLSDFLANSVSIDTTNPVTPRDRQVNREINEMISKGDLASPGAAYDATDEIQSLAASGASAGTFDITVGVYDSVNGVERQVDVTSIAYNAAPAAIQTAVDSAVGALVPNYTNGDITVGGAGTAESDPTTFTYDGASVSGTNHPEGTVDGTGLTGGGTEAFSTSTAGQSQRAEWAIMGAFSLVGFASPPTQAGSLPTLTKIIDKSAQQVFSDGTLRAIASECAIKDRIDGLEAALLDAMGL